MEGKVGSFISLLFPSSPHCPSPLTPPRLTVDVLKRVLGDLPPDSRAAKEISALIGVHENFSDLYHQLNENVTGELYGYNEDLMIPLLNVLLGRLNLEKDDSEVPEDAHPLNTNIVEAMAKLTVEPIGARNLKPSSSK